MRSTASRSARTLSADPTMTASATDAISAMIETQLTELAEPEPEGAE